MKPLERRVQSLEGSGGFYTIGELLDHLDGEPLAAGKSFSPAFLALWRNWGTGE